MPPSFCWRTVTETSSSLQWKTSYNPERVNKIKEVRLAKGLSQRVVALACGVTQDTVGRWERGVFGVTRRHQIKLARTLGVSVADLQLENGNS